MQFEGHDVYYGVGLKKSLQAPSDFCFCLKVAISYLFAVLLTISCIRHRLQPHQLWDQKMVKCFVQNLNNF